MTAMSATSQTCPVCGEDVLPAMVRCRGCGQRLIDVASPHPTEAGARDLSASPARQATLEVAIQPANVDALTHPKTTAQSSTAAPPPAAGTAIVVKCTCGHRFRVRGERTGRKAKCTKCGAAIGVAVDSTPATAPRARFATYSEHAAALEKKPPNVAKPVQLRKTTLGWNLNRMIHRLERRNGDNSERAGERRRATLELAATRDIRAVAAILPLTDDPWEVVRQGAAQALGDLGDAAAVPALVRLLDETNLDVKREAIASLGKIGDGRAAPPLLAIAVQEPGVRFLATDALVKIGKPAVSHLAQELGGPDTGFALQALIALQRMKAASAAEPLIKALEHPLALIRAHAAEALGSLSIRAAMPALQKTLDDVNPAVRAATLIALRKFGDRKFVTQFAALLHDEDPDVRERAIEAVGELGDDTLAPMILPSLSHPAASVRAAAADALRRLGNEAAASQFLTMLTDENEQVRLKAIDAVSRFKCREAIPPLIMLLQNCSWAVRANAAEALGEIGQASAAAALHTTLKYDEVVEVRMAAAKSLGKIRDPQSVKPLEEALQDEHSVRCRAITALGKIAAKSSQAALLAMLRDPAPEIRFHAAQALGELGDANAARSLECLLSDESALVRRGAVKALIKLGDPRGEALNELAEHPPHVRGLRTGSGQRFRSWAGLALIVILIVAGAGWGFWQFGASSRRAAAPGQTPSLRGRVASLAMSLDGQRVAVGRTRGLIEVWDLHSGTITERIPSGRIDEVTAMAYGADGESLLVVSGPSVLSVRQGKVLERKSHKQVVQTIRVGPGSTHGATWSPAADIHIWNMQSAMVEASLQLYAANLQNLAIDANGKRIAWGNADGTIVIWDVAENESAQELKIEQGPITGLAFNVEGTLLVAAGPAIGLMVWDLAKAEAVRHVPAVEPGKPYYQQVLFASDGKRVLALRGRQVDSVSLENDEPPSTLTEGQGALGEIVAIDPRATRFVSGDREHTAIWAFELATSKPPAKLDERTTK